MLIPRITNIATLQSAGLASALGRLPVRLYTNSSDAIVDIESSTSIGNTWVQTSQLGSVDELIALFDQGIEGVIVSDDVYQQLAASESEQLGRIPQARLGVYFGLLSDQKAEQFLVNVITRVAMVVLPSGVAESNRAALVSAVAQAEKAGYLPEVGGARRVVVDLWENASVEAISGYAQAGCSVIVPAEALSLDSQRGISVGSAFVAANGLHSDRPDGLFVTVVCDERNECLGVVYSNQESILEALKTGEGVY
ncbi:trifunctional histidinol dehydrogenase, partial [Spiromyces aspiralis]